MKIKRTSMFSGVTRTLDLPITEEQLAAWKAGTLIQEAMPELTADEREFVMTGVTAQEWSHEFGDDDDDTIHDTKGDGSQVFKGGTEYELLSDDEIEHLAKEYDL